MIIYEYVVSFFVFCGFQGTAGRCERNVNELSLEMSVFDLNKME